MQKYNKNYQKLKEYFFINGKLLNFSVGQLLTTKDYVTGQVFLIKSGEARLIDEVNGSKTTISNLICGDLIGIASILGGKPLEEVRAKRNLIVYSISDTEFHDIYHNNKYVKQFCDEFIWEAEIYPFLILNFLLKLLRQ